jgi:ABC-type polysaccharide/polyol phosphate transport system ATPase subunit
LITRIEIHDVVQRYRLIRERSDTLRDAFTKLFKGNRGINLEALRGVSLTVQQGEVLGIIGRNGSGKSTLLKVIAGVLKPTSGTARITGTVAPLIELGSGFHPDLTGRENILLSGLLLGLSRKQIREKESAIIAFSELQEFIDSPVKQYSSGMFMRLAFSIAAEVDPDIFLIDEILAVGDEEFRDKCDDRIRGFLARGKTMALVSHDIDAVRKICTRVIVVDHGKILADGAPDASIATYNALIHHPHLVS